MSLEVGSSSQATRRLSRTREAKPLSPCDHGVRIASKGCRETAVAFSFFRALCSALTAEKHVPDKACGFGLPKCAHGAEHAGAEDCPVTGGGKGGGREEERKREGKACSYRQRAGR